jgi:hypothetical protein
MWSEAAFLWALSFHLHYSLKKKYKSILWHNNLKEINADLIFICLAFGESGCGEQLFPLLNVTVYL